MTVQVYSYSESVEVSNAVGKYILDIQQKALKNSPTFKIALSGGSLGKVLKKCLIENKEIGELIEWDKWEVWFSDERLVPLDHEDSNFGLFNSLVLKSLGDNVAKPKVHTIREDLLTGKDGQIEGSDNAKDLEIAKIYESELPPNAKFDLILLGCGPDGHTCSLFPGHKLLKERSQLISYISDSPKPPPRRISFTFPVLENANSIAFVAEGSGKAAVLKKIFSREASDLPSKLVNNLTTGVKVSWFTDTSALNGVDVVPSKY